ncbi:hypothetical protein EV363DRAFT_1457371 [Boletus edulis]|nr:hypothetical protein EV363DRAFT_1457371 [Boletus edulis]
MAITILEGLIGSTPVRDNWYRAGLANLGVVLSDAVELTPPVNRTPHGHPDNPNRVNNLGSCFLTRFKRIGELSDLEHAISMLTDALARFPRGHRHKPILLNNLGCCFHARFRRLGEPSDLKKSISILRAAVELTLDDHPHKPTYLSSLGNAFKARFDRLRKPALLNSLGSSLRARFERLGEPSDLEGAILRHRSANDLTPRNHPSKPSCLNHLGKSFFIRFRRLGEMSDLEEAISRYIDAISLTLFGHPHMPGRLHNLAFNNFIFTRCFGPITTRFDASQNWISCARHARHHSLFHAHFVAIILLPQLAWIGFSLTHRYQELRYGADVVREAAAAAALDTGLPETAVEWLEQGRSIIWGELHQLRSSDEYLTSAHPEHAHKTPGAFFRIRASRSCPGTISK